MRINAVIFVPPTNDAERWLAVCGAYCARHRYQIVAVATSYDDAVTMLRNDEASVLVVADRNQLPPNRLPRMEIIAEVSTVQASQAQRRPQRRVSVAH